ncbi:MAG: hypothetical protein AAFX58_05190 [Pseudomonadota bacterium]
MAVIEINSEVEEAEWTALQDIARESGRSISELLTDAIADYVRERRLRPVVLDHLAASMDDNEELGRWLAL